MNWITMLFNTSKKTPLMNMFGRKRNNRGMVWGSILSVVLSLVAYGVSRNRNLNNNMLQPIQNYMNNMDLGNMLRKRNMAGLTEFAKEIMPNNPKNTSYASQANNSNNTIYTSNANNSNTTSHTSNANNPNVTYTNNFPKK